MFVQVCGDPRADEATEGGRPLPPLRMVARRLAPLVALLLPLAALAQDGLPVGFGFAYLGGTDGQPVVTTSNRAIEAYRSGNVAAGGGGAAATGGGPD